MRNTQNLTGFVRGRNQFNLMPNRIPQFRCNCYWRHLGSEPVWAISRYLTCIPCFWAISFNCSRVSCFGGAPGGLLPHERTLRVRVVPRPKVAIAHCRDSQRHAKRPWEYKSSNPFFNRHAGVAQHTKAGAFKNEQHLICFLMLMDLDAGMDRHLLRSQGHFV